MQRKKKILLLLLIVILALFVLSWVKQFIAIDICLDRGGRWNYDKEQCELE
jgi:hypothetical protein